MIKIDQSSLVGRGHHREVHRHPEDKNLCIKIVVDGNPDAPQVQREKRYYRHLQKRGVTWDMLPRYYGDITTNLGIGSVFDLILDQDGTVSKPLGHYIASNDVTEAYYDGLSNSLYLLKDYLLEQRIITMTLVPRNVVCQRNKSRIFRLFVVDNIGNTEFIPICNYIPFFAKKKIRRRWKRFEDNLLNASPHNEALHRMVINEKADEQ